MRKFKFLTIAFLGLLVFAGCTKKQEMDINMTLVEDGNLRVRITNNADAGIADVNVKLYSYESSPLEETTTDADGWASFNDILSGEYEIEAEDVQIGAYSYNVYQIVQVLAGGEKEYSLRASDYSGSATIYVETWDNILSEYVPLEGLNVGIFSYYDLDNATDFEGLMDILLDSGLTDSDGIVEFTELPLDIYGLVLYVDETDYEVYPSEIYLSQKGEEEYSYMEFYPN
jgi:hypothetical protein